MRMGLYEFLIQHENQFAKAKLCVENTLILALYTVKPSEQFM